MKLLGIGLAFTIAASASADWPTYQGNAAHSGYVNTSADLSQIDEKWTSKIDQQPAYIGIAVGGGQVYVSTYSNTSRGVRALSLADGTLSWSIPITGLSRVNPPAYSNGRVYFQRVNSHYDTYLNCYDAATGVFVFRSPHGAQNETYLAPTIVDNTVYINGGTYGGMYAFEAQTGAPGWYVGLNQYDDWTPAVNESLCLAYMGTGSSFAGGLFAVNRTTGQLVFRIIDARASQSYEVGSSVALDGDHCYATDSNRLLKFNLLSRSIDWESARNFRGQVTIGQSEVFVMDAGAITAVNKQNGAFLWQTISVHGNITGPIISTNRHLIAQTATHTVMFDIATHAEVWSEPVRGPMALVDDVLYVAGDEIHAFSIGGGQHSLNRIELSKQSVAGANSVLATVYMSTKAIEDETVRVWDNTQLISTPEQVIVRAGGRTGSVRLTTIPVAVAAVRTVYAKFLGQTKSADITLLPYGPSSMEINPSAVPGGFMCSARAVLNGPAPAGGQLLEVISDSAYAIPPATVTVPAGKAEVRFQVPTTAPSSIQRARIRVRLKGVSVSRELVIYRP